MLVQLVHGVRVLAERRVRVANELSAIVGQLDLLLLFVEIEMDVAVHVLGEFVGLLLIFGGFLVSEEVFRNVRFGTTLWSRRQAASFEREVG